MSPSVISERPAALSPASETAALDLQRGSLDQAPGDLA